MKDLTDVFNENTIEQTEEDIGLYTTIRHATLKNGSQWILAKGAGPATAVPVIGDVKRDDLRIYADNFRQLHVEIVVREGLI